jgi:hypothetical protein
MNECGVAAAMSLDQSEQTPLSRKNIAVEGHELLVDIRCVIEHHTLTLNPGMGLEDAAIPAKTDTQVTLDAEAAKPPPQRKRTMKTSGPAEPLSAGYFQNPSYHLRLCDIC